MDSRSENFRVNVRGEKSIPGVGTIHRIDHVFDIEANNRESAENLAVERANEKSDDENYSYTSVRAFRAKPREQQNYSGVEDEG